jgi:hypothetical protein
MRTYAETQAHPQQEIRPSRAAATAPAAAGGLHGAARILHLQRTAGNQATGRLLLQQERARQAADQGSLPPHVHEVVRAPGQPLDSEARAEWEPHFGHDFGDVRVHTDGSAVASARALQARAYTVGGDVVFAQGQYAPATPDGRRLLAHELAHVVEQRNGPPTIQRAPDPTLPPVPRRRPTELLTTPRGPSGITDEEIYAPVTEAEEKERAEKAQLIEGAVEELRQRTMEWGPAGTEALVLMDGESDQAFALNVLAGVLQNSTTGYLGARTIDAPIRRPIVQRYEKWLRAVDQARQQVCESGSQGFFERQRARGNADDPCERWFSEESGSKGPLKLDDLGARIAFNRQLDTLVDQVYYSVLEYRKKTDPYWLKQEYWANYMVNAGLLLAGAVSQYVNRAPTPRQLPSGTPPGAYKRGDIISTPLGPAKIVATDPDGSNMVVQPLIPPTAPGGALPSGSSSGSTSLVPAPPRVSPGVTPSTGPGPQGQTGATTGTPGGGTTVLSPPPAQPLLGAGDIMARFNTLAGRNVIVGVQAIIKAKATGPPVVQGLQSGTFTQFQGERAGALGPSGRAGQLSPVRQPQDIGGRRGSHQPPAGLVVEPPQGAHHLEAFAWNTRDPVRGDNASHAERQIIDWLADQPHQWLKQLESVDIGVYGRAICPHCLRHLQHLQNWFKEHFPNIKLQWAEGAGAPGAANAPAGAGTP